MISDYKQPGPDQITTHTQCAKCFLRVVMSEGYQWNECTCGGELVECGLSYPANPDDWHNDLNEGGGYVC